MARRESSSPLVAVDDLSVSFSTSRGLVDALRGVDLRLGAGDYLAIVGESGSGKSVLARSLLGLLPPSASVTGRAVLGDVDLLDARARERSHVLGRRIALVFQDPKTALNPVRRLGSQVSEVFRVHRHMDRSSAALAATDMLERVGLPDPVRTFRAYPHELSGGMRQRVCLAMAVACAPEVLIADEPTTALDVTVQKQVLDLLEELRGSIGMSVILISHDLSVVSGRADRIMVMNAGRVVERGPARAVLEAPSHPYTASLIAAVPRLDVPARTGLRANLLQARPAAGRCDFVDSCSLAEERCRTMEPALPVNPEIRGAACLVSSGTSRRVPAS